MIIKHIFLGTKRVPRVYKGTTIIWQEHSGHQWLGYIEDSLIFEYLAKVSQATGLAVTVFYDDTFLHNTYPFSATALKTIIANKDTFSNNLVPESVIAVISKVYGKDVFKNGTTPISVIPLHAIAEVQQDFLFDNSGVQPFAAIALQPKTTHKICFYSRPDVTNTLILKATSSSSEIIRYKAWAHNYIEVDTQAAGYIVVSDDVLAYPGIVLPAGGSDSLVILPNITGNNAFTNVAGASASELFRLTEGSHTVLGSPATSKLNFVFTQLSNASAGIGVSALARLDQLLLLTSVAFSGYGVDAASIFDMQLTKKSVGSIATGKQASSSFDMQLKYLSEAISAYMMQAGHTGSLVLVGSVSADTFITLYTSGSSTEVFVDSIAGQEKQTTLTSGSKKYCFIDNVGLYLPMAQDAILIDTTVIKESIDTYSADISLAKGKEILTVVHKVIADSEFVWIYPEWVTDDTLYIRCAYSVTQENDTLFID